MPSEVLPKLDIALISPVAVSITTAVPWSASYLSNCSNKEWWVISWNPTLIVVTISEPETGSILFVDEMGFHLPFEIFCINWIPFFPLNSFPKACSRPTPLNLLSLIFLSLPIVLSWLQKK